jgi:hypothetical protein
MSVAVIAAAAAAVAAAWPVNSVQAFNCTLERDIITNHVEGEWKVATGGTPRNSFRYKETKLTLFPDHRISIDLPEESLHLSGEFKAISTADGIVSWTASSPGYCGVLDAQCVPSGAFYIDDAKRNVLSIYVPLFAKKDGRKSFASVQYLYTCEPAA